MRQIILFICLFIIVHKFDPGNSHQGQAASWQSETSGAGWRHISTAGASSWCLLLVPPPVLPCLVLYCAV